MTPDDIEQGQYVICHCFFKAGSSSSFLLPTRLISKARPLAEEYAQKHWPGQVEKLQFVRSNKGWAEALLMHGKYEKTQVSSALSEVLG